MTILMKKVLIVALFMAGWLIPETNAQKVAVKSNLLYDATATMNLGLEFGLARKWTLEVPFNYNPWKLSDGKRLRHFGVQPEVRYWFCERFTRTFVGFHAHYADFNVGGFPNWSFISKNMQNNRYQGWLYGAGFSFGHSWILKKRWSIEAVIGLGYAHIKYDKYPCAECGLKLKKDSKDYFGPTKVGITLVYLIK